MTTPNAHSSHAVLIAEIVDLRAALAKSEARYSALENQLKHTVEAAEARLAEAQDNFRKHHIGCGWREEAEESERKREAAEAEVAALKVAGQKSCEHEGCLSGACIALCRDIYSKEFPDAPHPAFFDDLFCLLGHRVKVAESDLAALKQESERMREALRRILTLQVRVAGGLTSSAAIADAVLFAGEALSPAPNPQEQKP